MYTDSEKTWINTSLSNNLSQKSTWHDNQSIMTYNVNNHAFAMKTLPMPVWFLNFSGAGNVCTFFQSCVENLNKKAASLDVSGHSSRCLCKANSLKHHKHPYNEGCKQNKKKIRHFSHHGRQRITGFQVLKVKVHPNIQSLSPPPGRWRFR